MTDKKDVKEETEFFPILKKYDISTVKIEDRGLEKYIKLDTKDLFLGAPYANRLFGKSKVSIIERLINNLMRTEVYTGKKTKSYKVVKKSFEIIEKRVKGNPLQTFIDAIQNAAPKEETTRLRFGGISVPKAVDIAPQRRLDTAIRNISQGAINASHKNKKKVESCLADEIIKASKNDPASFSIAKKNDMERIARSAR
jgi:small subunit ribosomal protein S7